MVFPAVAAENIQFSAIQVHILRADFSFYRPAGFCLSSKDAAVSADLDRAVLYAEPAGLAQSG